MRKIKACPGGKFCFHDCFDSLSTEAMRAEAQFIGCFSSTQTQMCYRERILPLINEHVHPGKLCAGGLTAELLAFSGIMLNRLVHRFDGSVLYPIDHLIEAFWLTLDDLLLLGLDWQKLCNKTHYPLTVLVDRCHFSAETLFRLVERYSQVQQLLLLETRYAALLNLNLPWWQRALKA